MQVQAGKIEAAATQILPTLRHPTDLILFKKSWGEIEVEHRRISDNGPGRGCTHRGGTPPESLTTGPDEGTRIEVEHHQNL